MPKVRRRPNHVVNGGQRPRRKLRHTKTASTTVAVEDSTNLQQPQGICERCSKIDFEALLEEGSKKAGWRNLGPLIEWDIESCPLCSFFRKTVAKNNRRTDKSSIQLYTYSNGSLFRPTWHENYYGGVALSRVWESSGIATLTTINWHEEDGFNPHRCLSIQKDTSSPVRVIQPSIDFRILQGWIDYCDRKHSTCSSDQDKQTSFQALSSIPSLKFIDCTTKAIVSAPAQAYRFIALSYVWGDVAETSGSTGALPQQLPDTIADALTVTLELGCQYLWIDRYCIPSEGNEKHEQISKMDVIYSQAHLTIIAAAGSSPTYGLPGVGIRLRPAHLHATVGKYSVVSLHDNPFVAIQSSAWAGRGWTYQEGVLSRRRLLFTDRQVYYECSGMHCCEAQNVDLDKLHVSTERGFEFPGSNDHNTGIFPKRLGVHAWDLMSGIREYASRSLSHPSDILNGFLGCLRAFEVGPSRIRNCHGVPILPFPCGISKGAFKWSAHEGFFAGLCWVPHSASRRRSGFPSWSWTGWYDRPGWAYIEEFWRDAPNDYNRKYLGAIHGEDMRVRVQSRDRGTMDFDAFYEDFYGQTNPQLLNALHVSGWVSKVIPSAFPPRDRDACSAKLILNSGDTGNWHFWRNSSGPIPSVTCLGLHLLTTDRVKYNRNYSETYIMIIQEVESGFFERIGLGMLKCEEHTSDRPAKSWKEFRLQ